MEHKAHLRVRSMNSNTAWALIVAELGYTVVHILTYVITLNFWNNYNPYYLAMFVAEELPNLFNFLICGSAVLDNWLPSVYTTVASDAALF